MRLILSLLAAGLAAAAAAQDSLPRDVVAPDLPPVAPLPYPAGLSMPWRIIGIDPEEVAAARPALAQSLVRLRAAWLAAPAPLTETLASRPPTRNRRRLTDQIAAGTPIARLPPPTVAVEPVWCSLMDRHVFHVTVADATRGTLLGAAHTTIPRTRWTALGDGRGAFLAAQLPALTEAALDKATRRSAAPAADALHVGLSLAQNTTRRDEGASHCVNLLLEERLAADYTVVKALGGDHLATVRDALGQPPAWRRPTRGLVLAWTPVPASGAPRLRREPGRPPRPFPVTLTLTAQLAETVFGRHVPWTHQSAWPFSVGADAQITFPIDAGLSQILEDERRSLLLADAPQAAKVDRAWVYLDRGRAWGLKMNDRLVADAGGELVKGHVVRFFGPEAGLVSPRGFKIREGAIVFVRKAQRQAAVGLTFRPDPRAYPTAYPIPPGG